MLYEAIRSTKSKIIIAGVAVLIVLAIVAAVIRSGDTYHLTPTSLMYDTASTQLRDGIVYAYNGSSFYTVPLHKNEKPTIRYSGVKLPTPETIIWSGTSGVIMNFNGSFVNTSVEADIRKNKYPYDTRTESTWYLDFSSGSLTMLGRYKIQNNLGFYSPSSRGIYFVSKGNDEGDGLQFFDQITKEVIPISELEGLASVTHIGECNVKSASGCLIAKPSSRLSDTKLISFTTDGSLKDILSIDGLILPTTSSSTYLSLNRKDIDSGNDDADIPVYTKGNIRDIANSVSADIETPFFPGTFLVTSPGEAKLAVIGSKEGSYIVSQSTLLGRVTANKSLNTNALVMQSTGSNGTLLIDTANGKAEVFSTDGSLNTNLQAVENLDKVFKDIEGCGSNIRRDTIDRSYITFYLADNDSFVSNVKRVSTCLDKLDIATTNFRYAFSSIDPQSSRITSD